MRFSIRDLLAFGLLVALAMLAFRTLQQANVERVRLTQMQSEVQRLELQLRTDHMSMHDAILPTRDEFESLQIVRRRAVEHFPLLRKKYSTMQPRGTDVLSIRRIPSWREDDRPWPVTYRMLVPHNRPVWLKFGVHPDDQTTHSPRHPGNESDLMTESPFRDSGPFQFRLPPGDQTVVIATGAVRDAELPVTITGYNNIASFPNQIKQFDTTTLRSAAALNSGVTIMTGRLRGPQRGQQYQVDFSLQVRSDAPACVSATDAQKFINWQRPDLLMPYRGGGKYDIREPEEKQSPP